MPTTATCPSCNGKMNVSEALLGKSIRCPRCKNIFTAPAPSGPEIIPDATPAARPARRPERTADSSTRVAMCRYCDAEFLIRQANVGESVRCPQCEERTTITDDEFLGLPPVEGDRGMAPYALTSAPKDKSRQWKAARQVEPIDDDDERSGWGDSEAGAWSSVKAGLIVVLVTFILGTIGLIAAGALVEKRDDGSGQTVVFLTLLLGGLFTAVGQGLCAGIPRRAGGKGLAGTSAVLGILSTLIILFIYLASKRVIVINVAPETEMVIAILYFVTAVVAALIWILFLIHLAVHLSATVLAVFTGIFGALFFAFVMFMVIQVSGNSGMNRGPFASEDTKFLVGLSVLAGLVYYLVLLIIHLVMVSMYGGVRRSR